MNPAAIINRMAAAGTWVLENSLLAARILLLVGIWGLAVFGWSTLGADALARRLPPVHQAAKTYAAEVQAYLTRLAGTLEPLAADPRLALGMSGEDGVESLEIRRAMYEFGYLNRLSQLYIWEEQTGTVGQLASSRPLADGVVAWLRTLDETPAALTAHELDGDARLFVAMHAADSATHVYLLMPTSWQAMVLGQPRAANIPEFRDSKGLILAANNGKVFQVPAYSREKPQPLAQLAPDRLGQPNVVQLPEGRLMVTAPVAGMPAWAVGYIMPASVALGTSRMAQWAVVAAALLASLLVLWKPSLPLRRKAVAKLAPVVSAIRPLTAPLVGSIAAVVSGQRQQPADGPVAMQPGQFARAMEPSTPARKGKVMTFGGNYGAKPKAKAAASNYMPMDKPPATPLEAPSLATVATPAPDALAELVDECLTHRRSQLLYQPIYQTSNGMPHFHEVLLRLIDRDGQPVSPATFLPVCETHGWLDRLDQHVVERVMELHFAGGMAPASALTLNITGASMDSLGYLQALFEAGHQVMGKLVFEISSQDLLKDPKAAGFLREAKELGGRLAVDYFGGSLAMVEASRKMGFDYIKMNCQRFGSDNAAKHELIALARATKRDGPAIMLEKVETVEMEVFARRAGVKYLQGYLMGKPKAEMVTTPLPGWSDMVRQEKAASTNGAEPESPAGAPPPAGQG